MTKINRETAIALAKEAGMAGMLTDVVCSLEEIHRLCNLAVAHSRKDAEPVAYRWVWKSKYPDIEGWCYQSTPPAYPERQEIENLYAHPPEADKLLQQALEALEYRLQQTRPIHQADVVMESIRTYLENKA